MFRRKPRSKSSFLLHHSSNRGSDIVKPDNTSLIVNESDTETDELPRELTSILSEDEDDNLQNTVRKSSSLMKSLSQKKQSTPLTQRSSQKRILKEKNHSTSQSFTNVKTNSSSPRLEPVSKFTSKADIEKPSYFDEVLKAGGASPLPGNSSYLMSEDHAVFSIKVNNKLKGSPENIQRFLNLIEEKINDNKSLQKMLAHTLTADDCEVARGPIQEPLMRMLLNVDSLQANLLKLLLNKIASLVLENKMEIENAQIVSSILRQMRFLNKEKDVKIASKLFEIIHIASLNVKREIIFILPEIISEEEMEETCTQLIDLLKFDTMLTHVIIDAVTNLPLNKAVQSQVCQKILNRLDKCPLEFLPSLVQFILNKCDSEDLTVVINRLRENLPFTPQHFQMKKVGSKSGSQRNKEDSDEDSYIKLTFENLRFSVMASKQMTDTWIKVISGINSSTEFRCIDLVMLIIFYDCLFGRKNQILQLIRNKIKSTVLSQGLVQNMFKILLVITQEYFSTILELASVLLKSFEQKISNFGACLYKECFIHFHFYMKQTVISEVLLHVGTGSPGTINTALCTLKDLCENEREALSQHTTSIMGLLIKVQDLNIAQVRLLMDVLSSLVFFKPLGDNNTFQDELQIFIRKQLISSKQEECKKGIAAAVMIGKHTGREGNCDESNLVQTNSLLEIAMGSCASSETKRGFFYDEFATMLEDAQLCALFLKSWNKKISTLVMDNLFVQNIEVECEDFPMSLQYSVDADHVEKIVFPVVDFVNKVCANKPLKVPVPVIPSTLRLLWSLEKNSTRILSIFYSSVIMPEMTVYGNFKNFDFHQRKKIMDCLFLCGNYLIECVNALCGHGLLDKALLRVSQLISVRKLIGHHIHLVPDYVPPVCQFHAPVQKPLVKKKILPKKPKKGRKRKLDETAGETSSHSLAESQPIPGTSASCGDPSDPQEQRSEDADLHSYSGYFRELHHLTHKLLSVNLNLRGNESSEESVDVEKTELQTSVVLFLLEDFIYKSEQVLKSSEGFHFRSKASISPRQNTTPESFIVTSIKILPNVMSKMEAFSAHCEELLKSSDWIYDSSGLYSEDACDVKLALAAGLRFLAEIITWRGFQNSDNKSLLKEILTILSGKVNPGGENSAAKSFNKIATEVASYLAGFSKTVLVLSGGLSIVKSVQSCLVFSESSDRELLGCLCHEFLCRKWLTANGAPERGPTYNQHVDFLLKTYFSSVKNKLQVVLSTAKTALSEIGGLSGKDSALKTFRTVYKSNFPLLYRTMCEALISASTEEFSRAEGDNQHALDAWNAIVETLLVLVEIAKVHSSRMILASLLKRSQSVIQLFLSKGMPVAEAALRVKSVEVLTLLKSLQLATRFLHSICCHSRITNDSVVAAHVPAIRSLCERLTLEVKGVMIMNEIPMECITIAILKNRDLKGNDIISQETFDEESDDSELPPEDTPDDERESRRDAEEEIEESNSVVY